MIFHRWDGRSNNSEGSTIGAIIVFGFIFLIIAVLTPIGLRIPIEFIQNMSCENNIDACLAWSFSGQPTFFGNEFNLLINRISPIYGETGFGSEGILIAIILFLLAN